MTYQHIDECWDELAKAKTIEEARQICEGFPRWSGDWEVYVSMGEVLVTNSWFSEDEEVWCERTEFLGIKAPEQEEG